MDATFTELALKASHHRSIEKLQIVGSSPQLLEVLRLIDHVADTDATVLIRGESGVGKELVAQAVHDRSRRAGGPLVVVDCGSLHESLVQSELFGHEMGAFTGASTRRKGLFEAADGGTIFLDEIGEMPAALQVKLLRVLESGLIRRVGGNAEVRVDVRVIAATNRDLDAMRREGTFRADLYYRLNMFPIEVPPLRERSQDIPALFEHFIRNSPIVARRRIRIDPRVFDILGQYSWPGNVRELENAASRSAILCDDGLLEPGHLPREVRESAPAATPRPDASRPAGPPHATRTLEEMERRHIREMLEYCNGNRRKAAAVLNISERNLYRRMKELEPLAPRRGGLEAPPATATSRSGSPVGSADSAGCPSASTV